MFGQQNIGRVDTEAAAAPAGHYVQATTAQGFIFVSGQLGVRPNGSHTYDLPFEEQVAQALENTLQILKAGGCEIQSILKVTAYIVGANNWTTFNRVFASVFGDVRPARAVVPVPDLHYGYQIEIDAVGLKTDPK